MCVPCQEVMLAEGILDCDPGTDGQGDEEPEEK
jgi:hypothetical protein